MYFRGNWQSMAEKEPPSGVLARFIQALIRGTGPPAAKRVGLPLFSRRNQETRYRTR